MYSVGEEEKAEVIIVFCYCEQVGRHLRVVQSPSGLSIPKKVVLSVTVMIGKRLFVHEFYNFSSLVWRLFGLWYYHFLQSLTSCRILIPSFFGYFKVIVPFAWLYGDTNMASQLRQEPSSPIHFKQWRMQAVWRHTEDTALVVKYSPRRRQKGWLCCDLFLQAPLYKVFQHCDLH